MTRGWAISPVIGTGVVDEEYITAVAGRLVFDPTKGPFRAAIGDREMPPGDRLEYIIGNSNWCLVAFEVADPSDFADQILLTEAELGGAIAAVPQERRQRLAQMAQRLGVADTGTARQRLRRLGRRLHGNFDETLHLGTSEAPPSGSFVNDTFTDPDGTTIAAHVGETGADWSPTAWSVAGDITILSNRMAAATAGRALIASGLPASADYDVEAVFNWATAASVGNSIGGRFLSATDDGYFVNHNATPNEWRLFKQVAGVSTQLAVYSDVAVQGESRTVKLELRNAAKKVYVNGVERISSTDNTHTAAGGVVVRSHGGTAATRCHIDSVTATDAGGGAAPQTLDLGGVAGAGAAGAQDATAGAVGLTVGGGAGEGRSGGANLVPGAIAISIAGAEGHGAGGGVAAASGAASVSLAGAEGRGTAGGALFVPGPVSLSIAGLMGSGGAGGAAFTSTTTIEIGAAEGRGGAGGAATTTGPVPLAVGSITGEGHPGGVTFTGGPVSFSLGGAQGAGAAGGADPRRPIGAIGRIDIAGGAVEALGVEAGSVEVVGISG